jgi:hypothetical protein
LKLTIGKLKALIKEAIDEPQTSTISWDWNEPPSQDDLVDALAPFGISVQEHPDFDGSDMFGFVLSKDSSESEKDKIIADLRKEVDQLRKAHSDASWEIQNSRDSFDDDRYGY